MTIIEKSKYDKVYLDEGELVSFQYFFFFIRKYGYNIH